MHASSSQTLDKSLWELRHHGKKCLALAWAIRRWSKDYSDDILRQMFEKLCDESNAYQEVFSRNGIEQHILATNSDHDTRVHFNNNDYSTACHTILPIVDPLLFAFIAEDMAFARTLLDELPDIPRSKLDVQLDEEFARAAASLRHNESHFPHQGDGLVERILDSCTPQEAAIFKCMLRRNHGRSFDIIGEECAESFQKTPPSDTAIVKALKRLENRLDEVAPGKYVLDISNKKRRAKLEQSGQEVDK